MTNEEEVTIPEIVDMIRCNEARTEEFGKIQSQTLEIQGEVVKTLNGVTGHFGRMIQVLINKGILTAKDIRWIRGETDDSDIL